MIFALLLAAGESKRMGSLKQLLPFGKSTIIETVIDNLLQSKVNEVLVVLGHQAERIKEAIGNRPVKIVTNPDYKSGMLSSTKAGLRSLEGNPKAVLIALVDQPWISTETIDLVLDAFLKSDRGITLPVYKGSRGHPVVFDLKYKEEILNLKEDSGLREVVRAHADDILEVEVDSESVLIDIDDPIAYKQAIVHKQEES